MTQIKALQSQAEVTMSNASHLKSGYRKLALPPGTDDTAASMQELGALQVLCAMMVLGSRGEKSFARKRILNFIAAGKRLAKADAKSVQIERRG
jgi:hypothetical protein